jgi:predicted SprT family Zn-dependent metalloprotease
MSQPPWNNVLTKLGDYARKRNYVIDTIPQGPTAEDYIDPQSKRIVLVNRRSKETMVFLALHELGHLLVWSRKKQHHSPGRANFSRNSLTSKITELSEEISAWDAGLALAKRLKIGLNKERWFSYRARCLATYLRALNV